MFTLVAGSPRWWWFLAVLAVLMTKNKQGVGRGTVFVKDENQLWNEWCTRKSQSPSYKKSAQTSFYSILKTLLSWTVSEKKSTNIPPHSSLFCWKVILHPTANLFLYISWMAARRASRSVHTSSGSLLDHTTRLLLPNCTTTVFLTAISTHIHVHVSYRQMHH